MAKKKRSQASVKKQSPVVVSQEENAQAQEVFEHYHEIAHKLHRSTNQQEAGAALTEIGNVPEAAQMALLKLLSKEQHIDAADVLNAVYELSPTKNVRKEARRALIRLEEARIYPRWSTPVERTSPFSIVDALPPPSREAPPRNLGPMDVVINFVEEWADGNFDTAYELLASDSSVREDLSLDEWVDRRDVWLDEANPDELQPNYIRVRDSQKSGLWLPFGAGRSSNRKEVEAYWSIEMEETPLSDTLPELPQATAVYQETGRHWFWASYTLVQEQGEWRIQSITDEGTNARNLSIDELQTRIQELDSYLDEFKEKYKPQDVRQFSEDEVQNYMEQFFWRVLQATCYTDALIEKLPLDRSLYEVAAARMLLFNQFERCLVYLEPLTELFGEERAIHYRELAAVQRQLSNKYFDIGYEERGERFIELAKEALQESLAIEDSWEAHISLAEFLIEDDLLDEAEEHLLHAKAMITEASDEAHIEMHLGEIATGRELYEEALGHYQRVAELEPNYTDSWVDLAKAYELLDNLEEAEAHYRHAIELDPGDEDLYYALSKMYADHNQPGKSIEAIEEGLSANPDSAILSTYLAMMYFEAGDYRQAEVFLEKAVRADPQSVAAQSLRQLLNFYKREAIPESNKPKLLDTKPHKKRRR